MHEQLSGTLTKRDAKQHITHTFTIPAGATRLQIAFDYAPARVPGGTNALHLSLFDPQEFRGAGHRRGELREAGEHYLIALSEAAATPGYTAGPLPAGAWSLVIDTHMILPDAPLSYQIVIDTSDAPLDAPVVVESQPQPALQRGQGWYRGDLHGHTVHSDGAWQIADLLAAASAYELDFVTLSDHNTVSGLAAFHRLAPPNLLTIGGSELTTYAGHALALGVRHWIDWRVRPGERSMPQIAAEVHAAGGIFIIAHPMSVGDPICTGCDWRYADMLPGPAQLVEVWNGGEWAGDSNNESALALWYSWLNQGHQVGATAGTDVHGPPPVGVRPGFNVVYADSLSEAAILRAVAQRHLFLSDGPRLDLVGQTASGIHAMMGDSLPVDRTTISAQWAGCNADDQVRLVADGQVLFAQPAGEHGAQEWELAAGQAHWCLLELRETNGRMRAVTNPLFMGAPAHSV